MLRKLTARHFVLFAILSSVACLAYFYSLDRVIFTSVHFVPIFRLLLTGYDAQTAWLSAAICVLAALWNRPNPILALVDVVSRHPARLAFSSVVVVSLGSIFVYHSYPFSMDEYAAVFQSKIFAAGHLYARFAPTTMDWLVVPGFNGKFLFASHETGRVLEGYWPGFALVLAPFTFLGMPWLCNALLAGFALYLTYSITCEITGDRRAAAWALLFTLGSGAFIAYAISFYSMLAHLTANLLFVRLLLKVTSTRALAAGLTGSLALVLHNPLPHALFAAPWILAIALDARTRGHLVPLAIGYLPGIVVGLLWLWLRIDVVPPVHAISDISAITDGVFGLPDWRLLNLRAASVAKMWTWAVPGLFLFAVYGFVQRRDLISVRLLAMSALLTFAAYLFIKLDQGHGWGYRYFHSAWGAIPVLAACAMTRIPDTHMRLVSFAGALCVLSLTLVVPFQLKQIDRIISRHLALIEPPRLPGNNVYFIRPDSGFYIGDMIQVDPFLRDKNLLLSSRGTELDAELVRQNWPNARMLVRGAWGEKWYLGDEDQRSRPDGKIDAKHFTLSFRRASGPTR